jgi:hypothetical protein
VLDGPAHGYVVHLSALFHDCDRFVTVNCGAGRKLSAQLDGDDLPNLVALRDEDAPLETLEQWHLWMSGGVPEAAKIYAHKGRAAQKVCIPNK